MCSSTDHRPHRPAAIALTAALLAFAPAAIAAEAADVEGCYSDAKDALQGGDFERAAAGFESCLPLVEGDEVGTWRVLVAAGYTYVQLDRPTRAIEHFQEFIARSDRHQAALAGKWRQRRDKAIEEVAALMQRALQTHAKLSVAVEPPEANVAINGQPRASRGVPVIIYLQPGEHTVTVSREGFETLQEHLRLDAGAFEALTVRLRPEEPARPAPTIELPSSDSILLDATLAPGDAPSNVGPWLLVGTAGAAAAAGVAFTVLSVGSHTQLQTLEAGASYDADVKRFNALLSRRNDQQTASFVLYGVAGAALVGGVSWLLVNELGAGEPAEVTATPRLDVSPLPGGGRATARWSF